jgi:serine/alanine adding enzyme
MMQEPSPPGGLQIAPIAASDGEDWDSYVTRHPNGTLYHSQAFRSLITTQFGHQTLYLAARDGTGEVVGVLPTIRLTSRLFGDYVVSLPYFSHGGALTDSPSIEAALMVECAHWAAAAGCSHVEIRNRAPASVNWTRRLDKVSMELALPASSEALSKQIGKKLRAQVKRPLREGATAIVGKHELLDDFYSVFAQNMRDLGTPVYQQDLFRGLLDAFPEQVHICVIKVGSEPAAVGLLIEDGTTMEIPWASSLRKFNRISVNMMLYWEVLKFSIEQGATTFDFGRSSRGGGTYNFKRQWGAQERQLHWHYWLRDPTDTPGLTVDNPKYQVAIAIWQKLPVWVTKIIGPQVVKYLP